MAGIGHDAFYLEPADDTVIPGRGVVSSVKTLQTFTIPDGMFGYIQSVSDRCETVTKMLPPGTHKNPVIKIRGLREHQSRFQKDVDLFVIVMLIKIINLFDIPDKKEAKEA